MKVSRHALLIGNGESIPPRLLHDYAKQADVLIAADGGANQALNAGLQPDVIIGDLDSVSDQARKKFASAQWLGIDNPNNTDLQKALDYLLQYGFKKCTLVGFNGGRMDFTLGNMLALCRYVKKLDLCLAGAGWEIYPVCKSKSWVAPRGTRVSFLPLTPCYQVTLAGLKYTLQRTYLPLGTTQTLSNQTSRKHFSVSLTKGVLLAYIETNQTKI